MPATGNRWITAVRAYIAACQNAIIGRPESLAVCRITMSQERSTASKLLRVTLGLLAFLLVAIAVLVATLSYTVPVVAQKLAERYDIELTIAEARINLLAGEVELQRVTARHSSSAERLELGLAAIDLEMAALRQREVQIDSLRISDLAIPVLQSDTGFSVAGIDPASFASEPGDDSSEAGPTEPPLLSWQAIELQNISLSYQQQREDGSAETLVDAVLETLQLGPFSVAQPDALTPVQAVLKTQGSKLSLGGDVQPLATGSPGHIATRLSGLDLQRALALAERFAIELPVPSTDIGGQLELESRVSWWLSEARSFVNLQQFNLQTRELLLALPEAKQQLDGQIDLHCEAIKVTLETTAIDASGCHGTSGELHFADQSLVPAVDLQLSAIELQLDRINSVHPEDPSTLSLKAALGKFGKLGIDGTLTPLSESPNGTLSLTGEQINLTELSGFSAAAINKVINKGALDFNAEGSIDQGILDSKLELLAHQLSLSAAKNSSAEGSAFESELGMPLNTALNLLRDKDDTIRLKIPVNGPLDDPNININSIINKAIFKTLQTAVLTQVGPLLALSALDKVKSLSDAAKLKAVVFDAGTETPAEGESEQLDKLVTFMDKREKLRLNVCGVATALDLATDATAPPASPASTEAALAIAEQRAVFAKNYFIERGIDGRRLILCAPRFDEGESALPRVAFSL